MNVKVSTPFEYKVNQLSQELTAIKRMNNLRALVSGFIIATGAPFFLIGPLIFIAGMWFDSARTVAVGLVLTVFAYAMYRYERSLRESIAIAKERYTEAAAELNDLTAS